MKFLNKIIEAHKPITLYSYIIYALSVTYFVSMDLCLKLYNDKQINLLVFIIIMYLDTFFLIKWYEKAEKYFDKKIKEEKETKK